MANHFRESVNPQSYLTISKMFPREVFVSVFYPVSAIAETGPGIESS
jgi:hypothetical protein